MPPSLSVQRASSRPRQILKRFVDGAEQDFGVMEPQEVRVEESRVNGVSFVVPINSIGGKQVDMQGDGAMPTMAYRRVFVSCSKGYVLLDSWN